MVTALSIYSLCTIPLDLCANGNPLGRTATGFVWRRHHKNYLVTNWHVVTGRNAESGEALPGIAARPDTLMAHFNTRLMNYGKLSRALRLRDDDHRPLWFVHPVHRRKRDVVALPLDIREDDSGIGLYPINSRDHEELQVGIGMDVFILGYPFGFELPGFPVWKRGSIASEPDLTNLGKGYLLVDTASRPGMSGAPVIHRSWGSHIVSSGGMVTDSMARTKFIGVYDTSATSRRCRASFLTIRLR
jgi:hypothetical protein